MEGFVVSTGQLLRRGSGSLASSSHSTGKTPAAFQKRTSQGSGSQQTKHQKTKLNKTPADPLTYYEVESNSDPEPLLMHSNVNQETGEGSEQKGQDDEGNKGNEDNENNESQEEDKGNKEDIVKYIVVND